MPSKEVFTDEDARLLTAADGATESTCEKLTSSRWTLAYMLAWMTLLVHCLRNCLSMTLVCLRHGEARGSDVNLAGAAAEISLNSTHAPYITREAEGVVLSSYFYGYLATPLFSTLVINRFGYKRVLAVSMGFSAALTFVTPVAIRHSVTLTVVVRALLGAVTGGVNPGATGLWAQWAPREEKATLIAISFTGSSSGNIVANSVSGLLCAIPWDDGWPFIFYTYGSLTVLWVGVWQYSTFESPDLHPRIRSKELELIHRRRQTCSDINCNDKQTAGTAGTPWKAILSSGPVYAFVLNNMAYIWILCFTATFLPIYLSEKLHFNIQQSGALSSLPFMVRLGTTALFATTADRLQSASLLSVSKNRKLFQIIGLVFPGALLCGVGYLGAHQRVAAIVLLVTALALHAACLSGFRVNPLDLAPRFAVTLTGIAQVCSNLTQIICPMITSYVISDGLHSSWFAMFLTSGAVGVIGAAVFVIFGSGNTQPWAV